MTGKRTSKHKFILTFCFSKNLIYGISSTQIYALQSQTNRVQTTSPLFHCPALTVTSLKFCPCPTFVGGNGFRQLLRVDDAGHIHSTSQPRLHHCPISCWLPATSLVLSLPRRCVYTVQQQALGRVRRHGARDHHWGGAPCWPLHRP